jgi:NDP-sugar pyrophosphorylase family protein
MKANPPFNIEDVPVLVLAGGLATRLGSLAQDMPKYLMPINETQCFADVHLDWLRKQGFRKVCLAIGKFGDQIKRHCGHGEKWGLEINYSEDGPVPMGTGGAVVQAIDRFSGDLDALAYPALCVTYGDTLLEFDVRDFLKKTTKIRDNIHA